ncbi:succinate dehydrogenase, cytochrome b556 subunit [Novosphingobium sp. FSY-8]|uniref:Succinate dehydrogenase cytochrome b556 subunit n=1 Tax=Novosphingobium ovatum TaxID=1908523 RepID=A0ABW9X9V8_9SPHN|nr:succinate dehydrogenase, cytochrome b556 subunit [Novosphingobium ovatum]NBC35320.1 succinate dehydrogenase, cytochrome b556 subunit [Novosphingobium ovatum]
MAQASTGRKARPLSPHLQIWRWGPAMAVSILHRVSGNGLAVVGLGALLCWLGALVGGEASYANFAAQAGTWYGRIVLIGISWAFFNHLCSGLRHFVLDIGAGFEVKSNNIWSIVSIVLGALLTAAFWAVLLLR